MIPRPSLVFDFAGGSEYFDPRLSFSRGGIGPYYDRNRTLRYRPQAAPRISWSGSTGLPLGLIAESARTNLALFSEQLDNAVWTKTGCTVTPDFTTAPDGNNTADLITVTAAGGGVSQPVTITANNAISYSFFAKAGTAPFLLITVGDGTNSISGWFNLANGSLGTMAPGNGTVTLAFGEIEAVGYGFYRATVHAYTSTSTVITGTVSAAQRDNTAPAAGDTVIAWGASAQQAGTYPLRGGYLPTLGSTVVKANEAIAFPLDASLVSTTAGTLVVEFAKPGPSALNYVATIGGSAQSSGQIQICYSRPSGVDFGTVMLNVFLGSLAQITLQVPNVPMTGEDPIRAACAFAANDFALVVNGGAPATAALGALPTSWTHLRIGGNSLFGSSGLVTIRRIIYCAQRLPNATLQALTS